VNNTVCPTKFGFLYGPATVERTCDGRFGVIVTVKGKKGAVELRVTPGGRVTVEKERPLHPHEKERLP